MNWKTYVVNNTICIVINTVTGSCKFDNLCPQLACVGDGTFMADNVGHRRPEEGVTLKVRGRRLHLWDANELLEFLFYVTYVFPPHLLYKLILFNSFYSFNV